MYALAAVFVADCLLRSYCHIFGPQWFDFKVRTQGEQQVIVGVPPGSAAERAGFHPGDILLALDGQPFRRFPDRWRMMANLEAGRRAFLVMELLLDGATLHDEIKHRGRLGGARTVHVFRGVCAAVESAYTRHLIHRDLQPENIFLVRVGGGNGETAKILDFGIAKFLSAWDEGMDEGALTETDAGILVGTPAYMSPEQLLGEKPDVSWDLWALAVTVYKTLTGALPFPTADRERWRRSLLAGLYTPLRNHLADCPIGLERFFSAALAADRELRPRSARELLHSLEKALA